MDALRDQIITAIISVREDVRWKPGSAARHLLKRKLRGHLPSDADAEDYDRVIHAVLDDKDAIVYVYRHHELLYVAVVAIVQNRHWLVMFSLDGLMETAYVVERPDYFLDKSVFARIGRLDEVLR